MEGLTSLPLPYLGGRGGQLGGLAYVWKIGKQQGNRSPFCQNYGSALNDYDQEFKRDVRAGDGSIAFLASCIPDLGLEAFPINHNTPARVANFNENH